MPLPASRSCLTLAAVQILRKSSPNAVSLVLSFAASRALPVGQRGLGSSSYIYCNGYSRLYCSPLSFLFFSQPEQPWPAVPVQVRSALRVPLNVD